MGRLNAFLIISCFLTVVLDLSLSVMFDVTDFGALGNGKDDDSQAFLKAWGKACTSSISATMLIPDGKSYLLNPLQFNGPCKGQSTQVQVDGTLVAPSSPSDWTGCVDNAWIEFSNVAHLHVFGKGKLNGQGSSWWKKSDTEHVFEINNKNKSSMTQEGGSGSTLTNKSSCSTPTGLRFESCNNLELRGLTHINPPCRHISIFGCTGVQISDLTITAPEDSPNTDGIDVSSSTNVNIVNSIIGTGDDCVAISSGSSNIYIGGVHCGPGHGISVGSLGEGGTSSAVDGVYVQNCTFTETENGVRIKTWPGGKGYARNITFTDIHLYDAKNCIIIDQKYCNGRSYCPEKDTAVQLSDIKYFNVRGTSSIQQAIFLDCSSHAPCKDIIMSNINITSYSKSAVGATCSNADVTTNTVSPNVSCH